MMSFKTNTHGRVAIGFVGSCLILAYALTIFVYLLEWFAPDSSWNSSIKKAALPLYDNTVARRSIGILLGVTSGIAVYYMYWRSCQKRESEVLIQVFKVIIIKRLRESRDDVGDFG